MDQKSGGDEHEGVYVCVYVCMCVCEGDGWGSTSSTNAHVIFRYVSPRDAVAHFFRNYPELTHPSSCVVRFQSEGSRIPSRSLTHPDASNWFFFTAISYFILLICQVAQDQGPLAVIGCLNPVKRGGEPPMAESGCNWRRLTEEVPAFFP